MGTQNKLANYYNNNQLDIEKVIEDFTPYVKTVINNGTNNLLSFEDKEEIFADTFFILWKNIERINIYSTISSYLAGIANNLIKEKYRKLKIAYDISDYENVIDGNIDFFEKDRDIVYDIEQKLKSMKQVDREIFNMYYYSSMSIKDISKALNISEINVKTRLHRIRKKIKKELEKGGK
ncbi:MAG: sigma-70 family RNA polymerase sigma factor [Clostridia bacterium]|nr:sigma-70 family RNA polymerase sigma factor [Clostridia bacterium]